MAGLVLWIPVFTGKTIPGVFEQFHKILYEVNILRKSGQVREKKHESNTGEYSREVLFWLFSCFETLIIRLMKWTDSKLCF
jgi:hypothetical protein